MKGRALLPVEARPSVDGRVHEVRITRHQLRMGLRKDRHRRRGRHMDQHKGRRLHMGRHKGRRQRMGHHKRCRMGLWC
jgi:hypothetical protein